jgi:putative transcriptional regulator
MTNKLRVLRTENNMTQEEIANKLGVTRQTIISIESGKYTPSLPLAFKIANLFKN